MSELDQLLDKIDATEGRTPPRRMRSNSYRERYYPLVEQAAAKYNIPVEIFDRLITQESGYKPHAIGPPTKSGRAKGIGQFTDDTARSFGINPLDPSQAIDATGRYLRKNFDQFGRWDLAAAGYNAGPGAVRKYKGVPPYRETQHYVSVVVPKEYRGEQPRYRQVGVKEETGALLDEVTAESSLERLLDKIDIREGRKPPPSAVTVNPVPAREQPTGTLKPVGPAATYQPPAPVPPATGLAYPRHGYVPPDNAQLEALKQKHKDKPRVVQAIERRQQVIAPSPAGIGNLRAIESQEAKRPRPIPKPGVPVPPQANLYGGGLLSGVSQRSAQRAADERRLEEARKQFEASPQWQAVVGADRFNPFSWDVNRRRTGPELAGAITEGLFFGLGQRQKELAILEHREGVLDGRFAPPPQIPKGKEREYLAKIRTLRPLIERYVQEQRDLLTARLEAGFKERQNAPPMDLYPKEAQASDRKWRAVRENAAGIFRSNVNAAGVETYLKQHGVKDLTPLQRQAVANVADAARFWTTKLPGIQNAYGGDVAILAGAELAGAAVAKPVSAALGRLSRTAPAQAVKRGAGEVIENLPPKAAPAVKKLVGKVGRTAIDPAAARDAVAGALTLNAQSVFSGEPQDFKTVLTNTLMGVGLGGGTSVGVKIGIDGLRFLKRRWQARGGTPEAMRAALDEVRTQPGAMEPVTRPGGAYKEKPKPRPKVATPPSKPLPPPLAEPGLPLRGTPKRGPVEVPAPEPARPSMTELLDQQAKAPVTEPTTPESPQTAEVPTAPLRVLDTGEIQLRGQKTFTAEQSADVHRLLNEPDNHGAIQKELGSQRYFRAVDALDEIQESGNLDTATSAYDEWLNKRRSIEAKRATAEVGKAARVDQQDVGTRLSEAHSQGLKVEHRVGDRTFRYRDISNLPVAERQAFYDAIATPGRLHTRGGKERVYATPQGSGSLRDVVVDMGLLPEDVRKPPVVKAPKPEVVAPKPEVVRPPEYGKSNKIFTEERANAARDRLNKKLGRLSSGVDPEFLRDAIDLAGYHIEAGARSFADYSKRMIEDLGEGIKPRLRQLYNAVRDDPEFDSSGMSTAAEIDAFEKGGAVSVAATPEPTPTPKPAPKPEIQPQPRNTTGLANQVLEREVKAGALKEMPKKGQGWINEKQALDAGAAAIDEGRIDPQKLADEIDRNPRPATAEEYGALTVEAARLKQEANRAYDAHQDNPGDEFLAEAYQRSQQDFQDFINKVQKAKTQSSASLNAIKAGIDIDTGSYADVIERVRKNRGAASEADLPQNVKDQVSEAVSEAKRLQKELDDARDAQAKHEKELADANRRIAEQEMELARRGDTETSTEGETLRTPPNREKARLQKRDRLKTEFRQLQNDLDKILADVKAGGTPLLSDPTGVGAAAEAARVAYEVVKRGGGPIAGRMAKNLVSQLGLGFEEAVERVIAILNKRGVDITFDEVVTDIVEDGGTRTVSRTRAQSDAAKLRAQAKQYQDLTKRIAALEGGQLPERKARAPKEPETGMLAEMKQRAADLEKELRKELDQPKRPRLTDQQLIENATERAKEYEEMVRTGVPPVAKQRRELAQAVKNAQALRDYQHRKVLALIEAQRPRTLGQKALGAVGNVRGLLLGGDIGVITRQGLFGLAHVPTAAKSIAQGAKAFWDEDNLARWEHDLNTREINGKLALAERRKAGLQVTDTLNNPEETVVARMLKKLPGGFGRLAGGLERFQTVFINNLRAELFDQGVRAGFSPEELKLRASFINNVTGRSNLKSIHPVAQFVFTSPRYEASRWMTLLEPFKNTAALAADAARGRLNRAAVANLKDMAATGAAIYGLYKAAELAGYQTEYDPTHTDFLKMRKGNEVWDPTAGMSPRTRDLMRAVVAFDRPNTMQKNAEEIGGAAIFRALSPGITVPLDQLSLAKQRREGVLEPKSYIRGFKSEGSREGLIAVMPLLWQSFGEALRQEGLGAAVSAAGREAIGQSVNRYPRPGKWGEPKKK